MVDYCRNLEQAEAELKQITLQLESEKRNASNKSIEIDSFKSRQVTLFLFIERAKLITVIRVSWRGCVAHSSPN